MATNKTVIKKQTNKQTKTIKNHYLSMEFLVKTTSGSNLQRKL